MAALEDSGHAESTLLIMTSDNGAHWLPEEIAKWDHRANDEWRGRRRRSGTRLNLAGGGTLFCGRGPLGGE